MKQLLFLLLLATIPNLLKAQYISPTQKKAIRWNNKSEYKKLSEEDGDYLLFNFGVRKHEAIDFSNLIYENLSGVLGLNYGVTRSNLGYEIGLDFIYHNNENEIYVPEIDQKFYVNRKINSLVVPLTVRYNIPLDASQRVRFGANFSVNWIAMPMHRSHLNGTGIVYSDNYESGQVRYSWENELKSSFFFKAGIHFKLKFLNSSYMILQTSQAFTFGPNRRFNFDWLSGDAQGEFHVDSRIDGFIGEIGYVIPLYVLGAKFKNGQVY